MPVPNRESPNAMLVQIGGRPRGSKNHREMLGIAGCVSKLGPAERQKKRRLRYKASGHYLRPAFHRCSMGQDRRNSGMVPDDLGDFPNITIQFTNRQWYVFANPLPDFYNSLVLEFYASYQARQESIHHRDKFDEFPCLPSIMVRVVEVDITPVAINSLFWEDEIDLGTEYLILGMNCMPK
ncbi:hypothetical protein HAX54_000259 [Datura stramonium]|uniref:Uncharacterized protein n=1 Tax=Datura stramonium TaxID=4076 RepID=A0ABS8WPR1_DATST|nr:hypothetical protein [Datura stramonium]